MNRFFYSLRLRVLLLVLLAVIPALALTFYSNREQNQFAATKAKEEAMLLTRITAMYHQRLLAETRQLLITLAQLPAVRERDAAACSKLLADLLRDFPLYSNLTVLDRDGGVFCSAIPVSQPLNMADLAWFKRVLETRDLTIGDYQIGRITGKPILVFAYPVLDSSGSMPAVITAPLDLTWLNEVAVQMQLPQHSTLTIRDSKGQILARYPDSEKWIGKSVPDSSIAKVILAQQGEGTTEAEGIDGIRRLYAFTPLYATAEGSVYLSIGIPSEAVYATIDRTFHRNYVYLGLVALLAMAAAWIGGHMFFLRGVHALLTATKRLASGDLSSRVVRPHGPGELGELAHTFDEMADTLEHRSTELRRAEAKYRTLVEQIPAVIYIASPEDPVATLYVSPQIEALLGYTQEEWKNNPCLRLDRIHPDDQERVLQEIHGLCTHDSPAQGLRLEYRIIPRRDHGKSVVWVLDQAFVTRDEAYASCFIQGILMDISELKEAHESLERLRHQNELILNSAGEGIFGLDTRGSVTFVNPSAAKTLGYEVEELLGRNMHQVVHHSKNDGLSYPQEECPICAAYKNGTVYRGDDEMFWRKDGNRFPVEYVSTPMLERGELAGTVVVFKDITVRKTGEEELSRLVTAVEQATESMIITDAAMHIQYVNPAFERISGYSSEDVIGRDPVMMRSGRHEKSFYDNMRDTLRRGEPWKGHLINRRKDGDIYEVEGTISPIRDKSGKIINYVSVQRDATHEAKLERQLRQAQKMEAIGRLAGGIAHDFNNILTAILGYTDITIESAPEGSSTRKNLGQVLKAANRARELVGQILAFSRQSEHEPKPIQLRFIINETIQLLRASLPSTIEIRKIMEATSSDTVLADPTQIHQVLMNLCTNAAHAMQEKGGLLEVKLATVELDSSSVPRQYPDLKPGLYLKLIVSDTGCGMDRSTLERIFDPYFTTKRQGEGTGLGLAVVHGIIKSHGGVISAYSEAGKGSTFQILLPRSVQRSEGEVTQHEAAKPIRGGNERILLVDDEQSIVEMAQLMLEGIGYNIIKTTNSTEALEIFRAQSREIDLVITDQTMPGMTGMTLAKEIINIRPNIAIILCTGFSEQITREKALALGIREFVMKPLVRRDLAQVIRKVLDQ